MRQDCEARATAEAGTREACLAGGGFRTRSFYRRSVLILSFGMLGVFGGFQAAQGLQTSLNDTLGFINLASLYAAFTLLCLIATPALEILEGAVGLRVVMLVSSLAYVAMILSNADTSNWALPISMNVLVGVGAPLLWTCQNDYVGRCAFHAAAQGQGAGDEQVGPDLETMTAEFNGLFFSVYQFAGMAGNLVASVVMLALRGRSWMKDVLFFVLGAVSLAGASTFLLMPRVGPANSQSDRASLQATVALALGDARMRFMIPVIFTNGMTLAFILGDYPADVICPVLGPSFTGLVVATFFGVNSAASAMWGRLIAKKSVSRRTAYVAAAFCIALFLLLRLLWHGPQNYQKQGGEWRELSRPAWASGLPVFLLAALFAVGDAFWESGPVATLQNFFLSTPKNLPAMANYKMWQSLGFVAQFVLGAELRDEPTIRVAILLVLCVASTGSLLWLNCKVASVQ